MIEARVLAGAVLAGAVLELQVLRVQVQLDRIKPGRAPWRRYQPEILREVAELWVDPDGAIGIDADGTEHIDVHHTTHPDSRDRKGRVGISIMTTGDYVALRRQYGRHLVDGIAAESMLLEYEPGLANVAMPDELLIAPGRLALTGVHIAKPCVEFTRFCLGLEASDTVGANVRQGMKDLDGGARGYKMVAATPGRIRPGDTVRIDLPTPRG